MIYGVGVLGWFQKKELKIGLSEVWNLDSIWREFVWDLGSALLLF